MLQPVISTQQQDLFASFLSLPNRLKALQVFSIYFILDYFQTSNLDDSQSLWLINWHLLPHCRKTSQFSLEAFLWVKSGPPSTAACWLWSFSSLTAHLKSAAMCNPSNPVHILLIPSAFCEGESDDPQIISFPSAQTEPVSWWKQQAEH